MRNGFLYEAKSSAKVTGLSVALAEVGNEADTGVVVGNKYGLVQRGKAAFFSNVVNVIERFYAPFDYNEFGVHSACDGFGLFLCVSDDSGIEVLVRLVVRNSDEDCNAGDTVNHQRSIDVGISNRVEACVSFVKSKSPLCVVEEVSCKAFVGLAVELVGLGHLLCSAINSVHRSISNVH